MRAGANMVIVWHTRCPGRTGAFSVGGNGAERQRDPRSARTRRGAASGQGGEPPVPSGRRLGAFLERQERAREEVTEQHAAMTDGQRRRRVLVEYHCTAGRPCLLLRIFASDDYGPAFYRPPYILTEERNLRASNEDGRAANTTDGANHWREGVGPWVTADGIESTAGWSLNCRHVDVSVRWADTVSYTHLTLPTSDLV